METIIEVADNPEDLAQGLAEEITDMIAAAAFRGKKFTIALSGGSTPRLLYTVLGDSFADRADWHRVHFFWGDERCVPPGDKESNFRMTREALLMKLNIPEENIHRITGEAKPWDEAKRYSSEILAHTSIINGLPSFDLMILGLGDDGHTASIFPGNEKLFESEKICETASHPVTGQKRITVTGTVINNSANIVFLVTGKAKSGIVADIIEKPGQADYPAALVEPVHGTLRWYLDLDAASLLGQWA